MCVVRDISDVSIEYFTNLVHSSSRSILFPEIFPHLGNSVHPDPIEVELLDHASNPFQKCLPHEGVILVKIRQAGKSANFNFMLVVPVINNAVRMIMGALIERGNFVEVHTDVCRMVSYDIKHHPNSFGLCRLDQISQVLLSAKIWVDLVPIKGSIAVVVISIVLRDGRDPYSIESHTFYIVKLILNSFESSTAVFVKIRAWRSASICPPEAVSYYLIYRSLFPFIFGMSRNISGHQSSKHS